MADERGDLPMPFEVEAVYEGGVLKPVRPLPLEDHQRVKVVVQEETSLARRSYGLIGWQGDLEVLRKIALDPEFGVTESP
jgi:predicted DNA-binding antitoxin AbrB/MazE fold protein